MLISAIGFEVGTTSTVVGNGVLTGPGTGGGVEGVGATGGGVTMIGRGVGGGDTGALVVGISPLSIVGTSVGVNVGISVSPTGTGKVGLVVGLGYKCVIVEREETNEYTKLTNSLNQHIRYTHTNKLTVSTLVGLGVGSGGPPPLLAGQNSSLV